MNRRFVLDWAVLRPGMAYARGTCVRYPRGRHAPEAAPITVVTEERLLLNHSRMTALLIAGLCLLMAFTARADTLTSQTVSRFVAAMEQLQNNEVFVGHFMAAWQAGRDVQAFPGSLMPSEKVALMEGREGQEMLESVIRDHGFDSPEAWGRAGDRALLALISLEVGDREPAMQKQLVQLQQDLDANPQFSEAQKQRLQQMVERTSQLLERVAEVPDADREAIRPHQQALIQALDYQAQY